MEPPGISVVIRTQNSAVTLRKVLARLDLGPSDEIVVVDSGSTDDTVAVAEAAHARVVRIPKERFTYGGALNVGFGAATRPWVLSLSSHCVPVHGDLLARFRKAVGWLDDRVTAVVGTIEGEFPSPLPDGVTLYHRGEMTRGFGFGAGNPNCLYRRSAWERRRFNESPHGCEDMRWYVAALEDGEVVAAVHAAAVEYASRRPLGALYRKGRMDRRHSLGLFEVYQPTVAGWFVRVLKMAAFALLGRTHWKTALGSIAYYSGMLAESMSKRRA